MHPRACLGHVVLPLLLSLSGCGEPAESRRPDAGTAADAPRGEAATGGVSLSVLRFKPLDLFVGETLSSITFRISSGGRASGTPLQIELGISQNATAGDVDDATLGTLRVEPTFSSSGVAEVTLDASALVALQMPEGHTGEHHLVARLQQTGGADAPAVSTDLLFVHPRPGYVTVVSKATWDLPEWQDVARVLETKHRGTTVVYAGWPPADADLAKIAADDPSHVCLVAQPAEVNEAWVRYWHGALRALDADGYGDAVWGVVTGRTAADAKRLASASGKLAIRKVLGKLGVPEWLAQFEAGTLHDQSDTKKMWTRSAGGAVTQRSDSPVDDTRALIDGLNANDVDLFLTSGHATEYQFQLHYPQPEPEGYLMSVAGQLYGKAADGSRHDATTGNAKVYYAPGNCLIAHIPDDRREEAMALGWLGSGGAVQFGGYIVPTWFGYMGWGLSEYWISLPGAHTFAESAFLVNQALLFDVSQKTAGLDPSGMSYDRDVFLLYGDPAFDARVKPMGSPSYEQQLEYVRLAPGQFSFRLTVRMKRNTSVAKPVIALLPFRIDDPVVTSAGDRTVDVTDNMVLLQIWKSGESTPQAGQVWAVIFTGRPRK